jgi:ribosomal protein S8
MIRRVSKPGQRVFSGYKHFNENIDGLRYNQGIAIISTSVGVVHAKATKLKGGVCYVG